MLGNIRQVRAEAAPVADRDLYGTRGYFFSVNGGFHSLSHQLAHIAVGTQPRVEVDQDRRIGGMQIQDAASPFQATRQKLHLAVRFERNLVAKRDEKRAVARRPDVHFP